MFILTIDGASAAGQAAIGTPTPWDARRSHRRATTSLSGTSSTGAHP
jgi:hypothetical protein